MKHWTLLAAIGFLVWSFSTAVALDFEPVESESGDYYLIASGTIRVGDDEKLHRLVSQMPAGSRITAIFLNSPGGSLYESPSGKFGFTLKALRPVVGA